MFNINKCTRPPNLTKKRSPIGHVNTLPLLSKTAAKLIITNYKHKENTCLAILWGKRPFVSF